MPTDAPTPSGAMLVWEPDYFDHDPVVSADTPFDTFYLIYPTGDAWHFSCGEMTRCGKGPHPDEAAARAACEADCREKVEKWARAAGWVPAGRSPLVWSKPRPADAVVSHYDHVIADTPLGQIILEWKGWKEDSCPTCEMPWGEFVVGEGLDDAKAQVQAAWDRKLALLPKPAPQEESHDGA